MGNACSSCNGTGRRLEAYGASIGDGGACYTCGGTGENPYAKPSNTRIEGTVYTEPVEQDSYKTIAFLISLVAGFFVGKFVYESLSTSWPYLISGIASIFIVYWFLNRAPVRRILEFIIKIIFLALIIYMIYHVGLSVDWWDK